MNPRLLEIQNEQQEQLLVIEQASASIAALNKEANEILTGKVRLEPPILLTFGKNVIQWKDGALAIRGKGYKFVKALYNADEMQLEIAALEEIVWKDDMEMKGKIIKQNTFIKALQRLAETLERAKFPYRLLPVESKERYEVVAQHQEKKPTSKRIQSRITGAQLGMTVNCPNVLSDK